MKHTEGMSAHDIALAYVQNEHHADFYMMAGHIRGRLCAMVYTRQQVLEGLESGRAYASGVFKAVGGQVKVMKTSELAFRQGLGAPRFILPSGYNVYKDLPADPNCANAPYARTWEKVCAELWSKFRPERVKWVGGLKNVQVDLTNGELRIEVKGYGGRLVEYNPSEVLPGKEEA